MEIKLRHSNLYEIILPFGTPISMYELSKSLMEHLNRPVWIIHYGTVPDDRGCVWLLEVRNYLVNKDEYKYLVDHYNLNLRGK